MIDLHAHSTMSLLDGYGSPADIVERMAELGREAVCITDHDNVYAHPALQKICQKKYPHIKPIFGAELRLVSDIRERQRHKSHITLLAKNQTGYRNLLQLVTLAHTSNYIYYNPSIDLSALEQHSDGLVVLSGCIASMINQAALADDLTMVVTRAKWFKEVFGDRFFLEVVPVDIEDTYKVAPVLRSLSKKLNIPMVLTNDCHFLSKGGDDLWRLLMAIKFRVPYAEVEHPPPNSCYYMTNDEAWQHMNTLLGDVFDGEEIVAMFDAQEHIAADCNVTIPKPGNIKYQVADVVGELKRRVNEGWTDRHLQGQEYKTRIIKEMDIIVRKGFADYFLAIADIANWAKSQNILMSPNRGSAGCCLVAYALGITEVDPLKYDLVMERFLSEDRTDLPDIDLDFEHRARKSVIEYMKTSFGADNVGQISTFVKFRGRNSLDEVGKAFKIPPDAIERVKANLVQREKADVRAECTIEDTLNEVFEVRRIADSYPALKYAARLEGQARHVGVHAAGVVISSDPLNECCALIEKSDDVSVSTLDGDAISYLGLLKVDILAVKELSQLKDICVDAGLDPKCIYSLPLDDRGALSIFNKSTRGIFQFESGIATSVAKQLGIQSFNDVVMTNALIRPGPRDSGNTATVIKSKHNKEQKDWGNDLMNQITSTTYGYAVFQEQVLRIMSEVAGLNYMDVAAIRTAMSKSYGVEFFEKYRQKFLDGARATQHLDEDVGNKIFDHVSTFGCLAGETKIPMFDHRAIRRKIPIKDVYNEWHGKMEGYDNGRPCVPRPFTTMSVDDNGKGFFNIVRNVVSSGIKECWEIVTNYSNKITASAVTYFVKRVDAHTGWVMMKELGVRDEVLGEHNGYVHWERIVSKRSVGDIPTWDMTTTEPMSNFVAEGLVVHNSWTFNQAHAIGYSLVAYAAAYMKYRYPTIFYKVLCNYEEDQEALHGLLRDYIKRTKGLVLPPKLNKSGVLWTAEGENLRAGLSAVLPEGASEELVKLYPIKDMADIESRAPKRKVNSRVRKLIADHRLLGDDDNYDLFGLYEFAERMSFVEGRGHRIGELGLAERPRNVLVAGVLNTPLTETSRGRGTFKLRDETGEVAVYLNDALYADLSVLFANKMPGQDIVMVKGKILATTGYILADDVIEVDDCKLPYAKCYKCSLNHAGFCGPNGAKDAAIAFVGQCPGEDEVGHIPFVGRAGGILKYIFENHGIDRTKVWITNAVCCQATTTEGSNRDPSDAEIACCNSRLRTELVAIHPKVVVALGKIAYKAITGQDALITEVAAHRMEMENYVVIPTFHPSSCFYGGDGDRKRQVISSSVKLALDVVRGVA